MFSGHNGRYSRIRTRSRQTHPQTAHTKKNIHTQTHTHTRFGSTLLTREKYTKQTKSSNKPANHESNLSNLILWCHLFPRGGIVWLSGATSLIMDHCPIHPSHPLRVITLSTLDQTQINSQHQQAHTHHTTQTNTATNIHTRTQKRMDEWTHRNTLAAATSSP